MEEAIQKLYRAVRDGSTFPGMLPDNQHGFVTTKAILDGLGLSERLPKHESSPLEKSQAPLSTDAPHLLQAQPSSASKPRININEGTHDANIAWNISIGAEEQSNSVNSLSSSGQFSQSFHQEGLFTYSHAQLFNTPATTGPLWCFSNDTDLSSSQDRRSSRDWNHASLADHPTYAAKNNASPVGLFDQPTGQQLLPFSPNSSSPVGLAFHDHSMPWPATMTAIDSTYLQHGWV